MRTLLALTLTLGAIHAATASDNPKLAPKGEYRFDPVHTLVTFCIEHMGLSQYCGRFTNTKGLVVFNGAQPEKSRAAVSIDLNSVDTASTELNKRLRAEFFETGKFPNATFETTTIEASGEKTGKITGTFTLHGVSKSVTLDAKFNGGKPHPLANGYALGFSGRTRLLISEFAFPDVAWRSFISDTVSISVEAELISQENAQ